MIYGSVCSGIEAATVAWHPLGFRPAFFSEIDRFPCKVLAHHYPDVPNAGDFTAIQKGDYDAIDLLVGGTPCQDFSVAGLRAGMDGKRGQLTVEFAHLAGRLRPKWVVWENVPGVLSIDGGRAFGTFLGMLGQLGYGFAYRVLDAQHFRVPQRRRRVFVVGYLGDWRRAAAVLFERESLSRHPAPRREKGQTDPTIPARSLGGGGLGTDFDCDGGLVASTGDWPADVAQTLDSHFGDKMGFEDQHINGGASLFVPVGGFSDVAHALRGEGFDASEDGAASGGRSRSYVAYGLDPELNGDRELIGPLNIGSATGGGQPARVAIGMAVRRLTPRECERLQGFPDDYTKISEKIADGPRYKALGNSMAVPCMAWIGKRIAEVDAI